MGIGGVREVRREREAPDGKGGGGRQMGWRGARWQGGKAKRCANGGRFGRWEEVEGAARWGRVVRKKVDGQRGGAGRVGRRGWTGGEEGLDGW